MAGKRGQGEGSITKRKDGLWQASVSYVDSITDKRKRPTVYGKTRKEVQEKLLKMLADLQAGINISPDKITVATWIERWLKDYCKPNVRIGTYEGYETNFKNHIKPSIGHIQLNKLTTNDLQRFYNQKLENGKIIRKKDKKDVTEEEKKLSVRTIKLIHVVINSSIKQALNEGLISRNVAEHVKLPQDKKKEIIPLSPDEIVKFLEFIQNDRLYPAFALELGTGMRRGELLGLQWKDINLETGQVKIQRSLVKNVSNTISINEPKTKASKRTIFIPKTTLEILKEHQKRQEKEKQKFSSSYHDLDWVFCAEDGKPLEPRNFTRHFERLLKSSGLQHVSFHALRHSVATALLNEGVNLKIVSALLGHSTVSVTADIYSHVLEEMKKETANVLDGLISKTNSGIIE